jgi:hypothetical protein
LASTAAAGGIALINSFGNLSGWLGPFMVGWLKDLTGTTSAGLYMVAGLEVLAAGLILLFTPRGVVQMEMSSVDERREACGSSKLCPPMKSTT